MRRIAQSLGPLARRMTTPNGGGLRRYAADAHGEVKYNCWEKPTQIAEWKEEHIVIAVLAGWGIGISTAFKVFGGEKKEEPAAAAQA
ncbi:hypothetical protein M9434_007089 [Picochlorum sp. BPE23]|nr:hypothetical protein M9434_007089 [Picochlorum sp. BPE23]KAI8102559.1 hypothetical protein M9435_006157 [Picochlorum sp. BPE23]